MIDSRQHFNSKQVSKQESLFRIRPDPDPGCGEYIPR